MPSEKEIKAAAEAIVTSLDEPMLGWAQVSTAAGAALSAAEKEREGETRAKRRQLDHDDYFGGGDPSKTALPAVREGDIIEKLREVGDPFWRSYRNGRYVAVEEMRAELGRMKRCTPYDTGWRDAVSRMEFFLNDLQEQSTPRETCERVGVGQGTDTWDPVCDLPPGHVGPCNFSGDPAKEVASDG